MLAEDHDQVAHLRRLQAQRVLHRSMDVARREYPRHTGAKLVFHRIGDRYFLAEVWGSSDAEGMIVPTAKQEKDLAKERQLAKGLSGRNEEVIVALN